MALQVVIAVSPVLERQNETRLDTHMEDWGSRHLFAHDEATCVGCAVRSTAARTPTQPATWLTVTTRSFMVDAYSPLGSTVDSSAENPPRAPPVTG